MGQIIYFDECVHLKSFTILVLADYVVSSAKHKPVDFWDCQTRVINIFIVNAQSHNIVLEFLQEGQLTMKLSSLTTLSLTLDAGCTLGSPFWLH